MISSINLKLHLKMHKITSQWNLYTFGYIQISFDSSNTLKLVKFHIQSAQTQLRTSTLHVRNAAFITQELIINTIFLKLKISNLKTKCKILIDMIDIIALKCHFNLLRCPAHINISSCNFQVDTFK